MGFRWIVRPVNTPRQRSDNLRMVALSAYIALCRYNVSNPRIGVAVVLLWWAVATCAMQYFVPQGDAVPDVRFGFTHQQLQELFFQKWSEQDRQAYVNFAWVDLLLYAENYTVALGSLLYWAASRRPGVLGAPNRVCLLALPGFLCDVVETTRCQHACRLGRTWELQIQIASVANQLKWSSLPLHLLLLIYIWLAPSAAATGATSSKEKQKRSD